ncbi:serine/threonine kinase [Bordetella ansorpii]|uniref:histidine kinase n=1 Tax=Bordetella ansorpii TaxID=288768 RepID=A0A157PKM2_9BORD|nr:ATP-binding protein [Bordetella ansorpii]SAI34057.1 serine/threonine kinase [Bordetella ansorpii]
MMSSHPLEYLSCEPAAPSSLYGREDSLRLLGEALARVRTQGGAELALICGPGGSGKSALVEALAQANDDARYVAGKSDLQQREIPYASLAQALRTLVWHGLTLPPAQRDALRQAWLAALDGRGRALAEIVPEALQLLGYAAPLPPAPAQQAQQRAQDAVLATLEVFASADAPLVLLLDNLQWADNSTLAFVQAFIARAPRHVLLLAAYRDDIDPQSCLGWLDHAHRTHALPITRLALGPLDEASLCRMVAAQLRASPIQIAPLAQAIQGMTHGNPFFARQLLATLLDDGVLRPGDHGWTWDEPALAENYPGTVTRLMARRFARLPQAGTTLMGHLACVGQHAPTRLLARIAQCSDAEVDAGLAPLVRAGLLIRAQDGHAFLHDRVLEAAYAMVPQESRPARHAHIASVMIALYGNRLAEHAFDICNQIEQSCGYDPKGAQRVAFAQALVAAARRAKNAAALPQAARHAEAALALMQSHWWEEHERLAYEASLLVCECLMAQPDMARAECEIDSLLARPLPVLDRAAAYRLKAALQTVQSDYESAITTALAGLAMLDVHLPRDAGPDDLRQAYDAVMRARGPRGIAELALTPPTDDRRIQAAMGLLSTLFASLFVSGGLSFLHLAKMVELTLDHGATPESPYGLAWFGVYAAGLYGEYEDGLAYGRAALDMIDRRGYEAERIGALVAVDQVSPWNQPLWFALEHARRAVRQGRASGDIGMACYASIHIVCDLLAMGEQLRLVDEEIEHGLALARLVQYRDVEDILRGQQAFVRRLRGEAASEPAAPPAPRLRDSGSQLTRFWMALYDGMGRAYLGQWREALDSLRIADSLAGMVPAHINGADCQLFLGLASARDSGGDPAERVQAVAACRAPFERWADLNPLTFRSKLLLLDAELARLRGEPLAALALYEQAAQAGKVAGFPHDQALAHEFAAQLCNQHGLRTAGAQHLHAAMLHYRHWGAEHKVALLARIQPELLADAARGRPADWQNGLKAAQALSGEVVMERLVQALLSNIVTHAGAQYGLLVLMRPQGPMIEASARVLGGTVSVHPGGGAPTEHALPLSVLRSVLRTHRMLVLDDATVQAPSLQDFTDAPRLLRSVLCLPLLRGAELIGVFYLENNAAAGVFDEARSAALEVLAPQLAIMLQTAQLYEQLLAENDRRSRAELDLRRAQADLARTSNLTVMGSLAASIAHEVNQPLTAIVASVDASVRWLNRPVPDLAEALQDMRHVKQNALRAADIIRALRALARQAPAVLAPLRLNDMLREALDMIRWDIDARGVRLHAPLRAGTATIAADRIQLQQVLLNLITNALDAMGETAPARRELEVASVLRDDRVEISVKDRGPGIAPETLPQIFDAFYTTKPHGMGMGLAICRSIIEAHGGTLEVRARAGGGSAFWFRLPVLAEG